MTDPDMTRWYQPIVDAMRRDGVPLTLENYLAEAYPDGLDKLSAEEIAMLPPGAEAYLGDTD